MAANESIEHSFGRTIGWFQCARSKGMFLSPTALREEYDKRFSRFTEERFQDFIRGYTEGFWQEYKSA